jgi:hypothetical protein
MYAEPGEDAESTNILAALMRALERPHVITERGPELFILQKAATTWPTRVFGTRHVARSLEELVLTGKKENPSVV